MPNLHVVQHENGWAVKEAGSEQVLSIHPTQREAIDAGRNIARCQRSELIIHGRDGRIRERSTYGNDPFPPGG